MDKNSISFFVNNHSMVRILKIRLYNKLVRKTYSRLKNLQNKTKGGKNMANLEEKKVSLKIILNTGKIKNDKAVLETMTIKDINPTATDKDLYEIGNEIVKLQEFELVEMQKQENSSIESEE